MKKIVAIFLMVLLLFSSIEVYAVDKELEEEKKDDFSQLEEIDDIDPIDKIDDNTNNTLEIDEDDPYIIYTIAQADIFTHEETVLPYRYVLPEDYNPEKEYPLILFLHAEKESGTDNTSQLRHCVDYIRRMQPQAIIVAPQCSSENQWVDVPVESGNYSVSEVPESNELKAVVALMDKMAIDFSVDMDRVSVVGVSMGGYGAWDLLMRHSDRFAAGVIMCGGGDPTQAEVLKDIPIYIFHGIDDEVVSPTVAREMRQSIVDVGGIKARYFEVQQSNHDACYELYFSSGVIQSLGRDRISDRNKKEDTKVEILDDNTVADAGVPQKPSFFRKLIFVWMPIVVGAVLVAMILKKVKF